MCFGWNDAAFGAIVVEVVVTTSLSIALSQLDTAGMHGMGHAARCWRARTCWWGGTAAMRCGVPLDPFALQVQVLVAALPSASNVTLLAERFGADNGRIARTILVTTAAAFVTFVTFVTFSAAVQRRV